MQPSGSAAHSSAVDAVGQLRPVAVLHGGSVLQVHAPEPAAPVQVWRMPHATGVS
jgi:hypothetical protein